MVTPMIKYTFLLHHRELDKLLEALGKSAIVDISVGNWNSDEKDKAIISEIQRVKQVVDKLEIAKSNNAKSENPLIPTGQKFEDAEQMLEIYDKAFSSLEQLSPLKQKYQREIDELRVWGEFSPELVGRLEKEGVYIHYFLVDAKKFDEQWLVQYPLTECGRYNSDVAFVVVSNSADEIVLEHAQNVKPLKHSVNERENDLLKLNEQIDDNNKIILSLAENVETLNHRHTELSEQLSERKVLQTKLSVADGELYIVEGFSPKDKCDDVDKLFFLNSSVIVLKESPKPEDNPPVLLKNNRFARLSEVITRLYALPQYNELDLTPFFAPFFVFFVGICMGDLGYGIVMAVGSVFAYLKFKESSFSAIAALAIWCSVATMIMGAVTGTFFGIALADTQSLGHLPFLGAMDMFTFSLAVGIIQILYATFIKAIFAMKSFGWRYSVPTLAWAFIIIVSLVAFLGGDMGIDFSFSSSSYTTIIAALFAIFILFSDPSQNNLLKNIGGGLWNVYNGLTGILGDTLSYIRLFALGLSSGIIGSVFNDLAVGMSPDVPVVKYLVMLIILLIGHGINIFMALISSFVHPLRLTFVEFYKSAGFEGGGREYVPFKKTNK